MQSPQEAFDTAWEELNEDQELSHINQIIDPDDEELAAAIWRAHQFAIGDEERYSETLRSGLIAVAEAWGLEIPQSR